MARVLLVDAEDDHLRLLSLKLRLAGLLVITAQSAEAGLALLDRSEIDLGLFELMIPGTNGLELARKVRACHPEVRVVLTSAYHLSERQLSRANCGAVGFVPKPYDVGELATFLRSKLAPPASHSRLVVTGSTRLPTHAHRLAVAGEVRSLTRTRREASVLRERGQGDER